MKRLALIKSVLHRADIRGSRMGKLRTNRELYLHIVDMPLSKEAEKRPLEDYLRALLELAKQHRDSEAIEIDDFAHMLEKAFTAPAPEPDWASAEPGEHPGGGFEKWERILLLQIRSLRRMEKDGSINDRLRYLDGVALPDGSVWFNFDPHSYLESGLSDTFGRHGASDESYMEYPVVNPAMQNEEDAASMLYQQYKTRQTAIVHVTWGDFIKFISCGKGHK